jgi:tetratricopeptide (TPR) repeat protein
MVQDVAARKALSEETIATVVERTGGVPLFVEELTRAVVESGGVKPGPREIPATLHDSLMARLDRLGPARDVIQVGAVIGSEFSYDLLHAIHPAAEEDLRSSLRALAEAELLYPRGIVPRSTYQFKHALIRDAAYEALLKSRRKQLHRRAALAISERFAALAEAQPEVLARHWTEAGEIEPAIAQWAKAGAAAQARNAFKEALESYKQALTLLKLLPESAERDGRELEIGQAVSLSAYVTKGNAAPEMVEINRRVAQLAERTGNLTLVLDSVGAKGLAAFAAGELRSAVALADQQLELAQRVGDRSRLATAHGFQIFTRYLLGDFAGAERHFTAALKFLEESGLWLYPGLAVSSFAYASLNAWTLGHAGVARERMARAMAAGSEGSPYDLAFSTSHAAHLRVNLGEFAQAETLAARALELSEQHRFQMVAAIARGFLGLAQAYLGRATEGIALIRQAISASLEIGMSLAVPQLSVALAAAQERAGAIVEALETVGQALQALPSDPIALRLRGELRAKQGQTELAEADFRTVIAHTQASGAKAWELRATTSLAHLLANQGRRDEARAMLQAIYDSFTDGFDTADLKDARALLGKLAGC